MLNSLHIPDFCSALITNQYSFWDEVGHYTHIIVHLNSESSTVAFWDVMLKSMSVFCK